MKRDVILQHCRQVPKLCPKEHIVHYREDGSDTDAGLHDVSGLMPGQIVKQHEPKHEGSSGQQKSAPYILERRAVFRQNNKFGRRRMDHRGGNQQPGKHSQKQTAESKEGGCLLLRLCKAGQGPAALSSSNQISEHGKLEQNAEQEDRQPAEAKPPVYQKEVGKKRQTQAGHERAGHGLPVLRGIDNILKERENIVQRPVKDQAGGRIVQQHQEDEGHPVKLKLILPGKILGINAAGNDVDGGHQDGKQIERNSPQLQKTVRCCQIRKRAEGGVVEIGEVG